MWLAPSLVEVEVVVYSLLCEVELVLATGLSLKCEVDCGYLAKGLPLLCEVVFVLPWWRLYWLREEFGTPGCIAPKFSVEVPSVGVLGGHS